MENVVSLIGSLGFPIVMTLLLFRQNEELSKTIQQLAGTLAELKQLIEDRIRKE